MDSFNLGQSLFKDETSFNPGLFVIATDLELGLRVTVQKQFFA